MLDFETLSGDPGLLETGVVGLLDIGVDGLLGIGVDGFKVESGDWGLLLGCKVLSGDRIEGDFGTGDTEPDFRGVAEIELRGVFPSWERNVNGVGARLPPVPT